MLLIKKLQLLFVFLFLFLVSQPNYAGPPHGFTTTNPSVRGASMPCTSFAGELVPFVANYATPGIGNPGMAARTYNGQPYIYINPNVTDPLPDLIVQFWFAHECAHHALPPHLNSEINADCFAVRNLRNIGLVNNAQQVQWMFEYLSGLPGSMMGHLPGPARAQNIYQCLNT
ncbi:hypothetical protein [Sessilibacter sp. MAH2]